MKNYIYIILCLFITSQSQAQANFNATTDSLNHLLTEPLADTTKCRLLFELGWHWAKKDLHKSMSYLEQALALAEEKHLPELVNTGMFQLSFGYRAKGDFAKSIEFLHCLLLVTPSSDVEYTTIVVFLSKNYSDVGDYENALYFHREAAKFSTFVYKNPTDSIPSSFDTREFLNKPLGFAEIFEKLNQLDSAVFYIEQSYTRLPFVSESDFWKGIFHWQILWSYGRIKQRLGQDASALALYRQALIEAEKTHIDAQIQTVQVSLAQYFYKYHQLDSAVFYAQPAFEQGRKTPNFQAVQEAGFLLKSIYEQLGKPKEALYYYTFANNAKDTLLNIKKLQEIQRLSIQQERRNKELALANMTQQNRLKLYTLLGGLLLALSTTLMLYRNNRQKQKLNEQLAFQKNEIETLNDNLEQKVDIRTAELQQALNEVQTAFNAGQTTERKRVSADLHDEIGSALSTIAIFSDLTKMKAQKFAPELVNELVNELDTIGKKSRDMIQTMRDTIWTLNEDSPQSVWERMQQSSLETLTAKNIALNWQLPAEKDLPNMPFDTKRHLFLAFKEAINNIVKHAEATTVDIEGWVENATFFLKIKDNGKGFDVKTIKKNGNGLDNFDKRMTSIGGKVTIESKNTEGVCILFALPIAH
jgi:signal transduction histidine kinase